MFEISPDLAARPIAVSFAPNRYEKSWEPYSDTFGNLISRLSKFRRGAKDGAALTQGKLFSGERKSKNVVANYILMVDYDTGDTLEEIEEKIRGAGLAALIWTTYSHLKPVTNVAESKFLNWARKEKIVPGQGSDLVPQFCRYLATTGKVKSSILDSMTGVDRIFAEGGVQYVVHHAPMSRCRALFLLSEPFDFTTGGSQDARIAEWKERYSAFCDGLGLAYDAKCVDPARLMYRPAIPLDANEADHCIKWIEGRPLDLGKVVRDADPLAAFTSINQAPTGTSGKLHLKTPGLARFLKDHGAEFNAAEFLRHVALDDVRSDTADKVECMCPNDHAHSDPGNPDDRAFFATDAISGEGWTMHCMHQSCHAESSEATGRPDRAWFLDRCCEKYGIEHANELLPYTLSYDPNAAPEKTQETAGFIDVLRTEAEALTTSSTGVEIDELLRRLAEQPVSMAVEEILRTIANKTEFALGALRTSLQTFRRALMTAVRLEGDNTLGGGSGAIQEPPPTDEELADGRRVVNTIHSYWGHSDQLRVAKAAFTLANKRYPTIFTKEEGGQVRIKRIEDGDIKKLFLEDSGDSRAMWTSELNAKLRFKRATDNGEEECPPWDAIVTEFCGSNSIDLPIIRSVSTVPVFSRDGELITKEGYNPSTRTYLWPREKYLEVPTEPTEAEVREAMDLLLEPLRDFPFTDVFNGTDPEPIRLDPPELDEENFPNPNWNRGFVSRMHTIGMILQPFMREMIRGACPIYHIDKSAPATGAGFLIDVVQIITTGDYAVSGTYNANQEEFRKEIFASLRRGATTLIYDNINDHVDDATLAQSVTSGMLRGRILGQSTEIDVPIRATWIMAGNNLTYSYEMTRRICPIRMDADLPDPAMDRPPEYFKYKNLRHWVEEHRVKLVWCCHVLIANWIAKGRPEAYQNTLSSFEEWGRCLGGVMEAAGFSGWMETARAYQASKNEEKGTSTIYVARLWETFKETLFTSREAFTVGCEDPSAGTPGVPRISALNQDAKWQYDDILLGGRDDSGRAMSLARYLKKHMVGKTYRVGTEGMMVKLATRTVHNQSMFVFQPV